MATTVRKVDYFYILTSNIPGAGATVLAALWDAGIDLLAFSGFPFGKKSQIDFIPKNPAAFKAAAKKIGLKLSPRKTGFLIQGEDQPGAIARIMGTLAHEDINVTAIDALCAGKGRYGALLWVKSKDIAKAAKALRAS